MRGTQALDRRGEDERALRRPRRRLRRIRRCARSGTSPRRCSRRSTTACSASTSSPSASPRACWRSSASSSAATPTSPSGSPATCCSSAPRRAPAGRGMRVPRLAAARAAYGLAEQTPTDYSLSVLGRFDPAIIAHAKKRVAAAKEAWSATAGGEMHRLAGLSEQFALVGDSLRRLFPFGEIVRRRAADARSQQTQAAQARAAGAAGDGSRDQPALPRGRARGRRLRPARARRPRASASASGSPLVRQKQPPEPLEPWMEELYRRVSDRQTMGSVVQELRASLSEVEKAIDKFFRNPATAQRAASTVPVQLSVDARRAVGARHGPGVAGAAAHARRGRRPGLDRGRSRQGRARPACSTASPATCARSAS